MSPTEEEISTMKKLISLAFVALVLQSSSSFAGWQQTEVIYQVKNATDQATIVTALKNAYELREDLIAMELASPVKLVVTRISVTLARYKWVNDATCQVPDVSEVPPMVVEDSSAFYHFNAPPGAESNLVKRGSLATPCALQGE
jgi:hypothetical protein